MTAALYDEVVAVAPARTLRVVRDTDRIAAPVPKTVTRRVGTQLLRAGNDPLVDGAARLLSIPVRHVYAALWRVGVLEVQA
jgi:hypothetical protein